MPENKPVQVMRFVSRGAHLDSLTSLDQLKGYGILEGECFVAPFVPFGGQPILVMLQGPQDKVRIDERSYRELKHTCSGELDPEIKRLVDSIDGYLTRVETQIQTVPTAWTEHYEGRFNKRV